MVVFFAAFLLVLFVPLAVSSQLQVVHMGMICSATGEAGFYASAGAIVLAWNDLRRDGYLMNVSLNFTWLSDNYQNPVTTIGNAVQLSIYERYDVVIGPPLPVYAPMVGYLMTYLNWPWFNWDIRDVVFDTSASYFPTLVKSSGNFYSIGVAVAEAMNYFGWTHMALLYYGDPTAGKMCVAFAQSVLSWFNTFSLSISYMYSFENLMNETQTIDSVLTATKQYARIIAICTTPDNLRQIMLRASALNMLDGYVYLTTPSTRFGMGTRNDQFYQGDAQDTAALNAFKHMFYLTFISAGRPINATFNQMVMDAISQPPISMQAPQGTTADSTASFLYDLVYLYGIAVHKVLENNLSIKDGSAMKKAVANVSFSGMTGDLVMLSDSTRLTSFILWCLNASSALYQPCLEFNAVVDQRNIETGNTFVVSSLPGLVYPSATGAFPADSPACGFFGELCVPGQNSTLVIEIVVPLVVVFILLCSAGAYSVYRGRKQMQSAMIIWRINQEDISLRHRNASAASKTMSGSSSSAVGDNSSVTQLSSTGTTSSEYSASKIAGLRENKIELALYRGADSVVIKRIRHLNPMLFSREVLDELRNMKELNHPNVNSFVGAYVDEPQSAFIVTRFCSRGSIRDVLQNDTDFRIDNTFKFAFFGDIISGMIYLHESPVKSNGNLKITNCLVDIRWNVKIADFGFHNLQTEMLDEKAANLEAMYRGLYWTSPELLRMHRPMPKGTSSGDIFSFAIIMYEIIFETEPYAKENPQDVITKVRDCVDGIYRPKIFDLPQHFSGFFPLLLSCWIEDPSSRPSFLKIRSRVKELTGGKDVVLIDEMLLKMERYTQQLEETVNQRTAALAEEKKKADALLYRMLPTMIADSLKMGVVVQPESYECATVMFTDVVRFTQISSHSSPHQIVAMLNTIYSEFDNIIRSHDAYKVETIGDAYMIVSGVPQRNGVKHAAEIADVALEFISTVLAFEIPHLPHTQLMIRVGVDSGQCAAGVIGSLMPHFCLFGDTVNSASRMESHGAPLRIHITENTKNLLLQFGVYVVASRGALTIKGKGEMETYWLLNKLGYPARLPNENELNVTFDSSGLPKKLVDTEQRGDKDNYKKVAVTLANDSTVTKSTLEQHQHHIVRVRPSSPPPPPTPMSHLQHC